MKRLGAIIAGGRSSRFGGDKGAARLDGRALIDHVVDALSPQVEALIICGREWPGLLAVADRPVPDLGPLGGLCAALHYAVAHGFDIVLTAGCDTLPVPDLRTLECDGLTLDGKGFRSPERSVGPGRALARPAVVAGQPLFGAWPVALARPLDRHLATATGRSMHHWITVAGVPQIALPTQFYNLNTPADFRHYTEFQGLAA